MNDRDEFAKTALPIVFQSMSSNLREFFNLEDNEGLQRSIARVAYQMADAMLAEREKKSDK